MTQLVWKVVRLSGNYVFDKDENLQADVKKVYKFTYKALNQGDNKQNMSLALAILHPTTTALIESHFLKLLESYFLQLLETKRFVVDN